MFCRIIKIIPKKNDRENIFDESSAEIKIFGLVRCDDGEQKQI